MAKIICNTGPLIALAGIGKLEVLNTLYTDVVVPVAVHQEIVNGGKLFTGLNEYNKATWLIKSDLKQSGDPLLATMLDAGEASVIHLAVELGISNILIDERKGRRIARDVYQLNVLGTARILVDAKKANLISDISETLREICNNGYWIHDKIIRRAIEEAEKS